MSFDTTCPSCGASSNVSVGICPYCKTVFVGNKKKDKDGHLISVLRQKYKAGKLQFVLRNIENLLKEKTKSKENVNLLSLYLKVLLEIDGPASKIRSIISLILIHDADNKQVINTLELLEAQTLFTKERNDDGEVKVKAVIKRDPNNAYAYFLLGSHLYWSDHDYRGAIIYLEKAVKIHDGFIRAWGCLGALYKTLGQTVAYKRAFKKAASLETNPQMKKFFKEA